MKHEVTASRRPFKVTAEIVETREYLVDAMTPEDAIALVENYIEDDEEGILVESRIEDILAEPVEEGADGDIVEDNGYVDGSMD